MGKKKHYMDAEGFRTSDWNDSRRGIKRAERWINEFLARGATVPEAMWDIKAFFDVAFENIRMARVRGRKKTVPPNGRIFIDVVNGVDHAATTQSQRASTWNPTRAAPAAGRNRARREAKKTVRPTRRG